MDPFTQRILERAEQRSKALGITNKTKIPFGNINSDTSHTSGVQLSPKRSPSKRTNTGNEHIKVTTSPHKRISDTSMSDAKENVDVAVEINITTGTNVQLQVEVEEHEIDEDGNILRKREKPITESIPMIRDSSRNRLQRLGALYSDAENLSSPIHKNEARFDENLQLLAQSSDVRNTNRKRIGKLAALADTINNWEDESIHSDKSKQNDDMSIAPKSRTLHESPRKEQTIRNGSKTSVKQAAENTEPFDGRQLQWDQHVMDALQMQGFEKRKSSSSKLVYDFKKQERERGGTNIEKLPTTSTATSNTVENENVQRKPITKKLVSNRTAIFENAKKISPQKTTKDPAELSIKERLALFERNKGTALIPKAALGMAPSAKQIFKSTTNHVKPDIQSTSTEKAKITSYNKAVFAESNASGDCIRNTVAALMSNTTTIAETQISDETRKQREREMNVLLNRFQKQSDNSNHDHNGPNQPTKPTAPPLTPPPAPPMPKNLLNTSAQAQTDAKSLTKRKSNEKIPADFECNVNDFASDKRKKSNSIDKCGRLYPILSDIESTTTPTSDRENCTTATISEDDRYHRDHHRRDSHRQFVNDSYGNEEDSFMEDVNSSDGSCNISLGREIMQAVRKNVAQSSQQEHEPYHYRHHHMNSSTTSDTSVNDMGDELDDYLDEALEDEEENDYFDEQDIGRRKSSVSSNSFSYEKNPTKLRTHQASIDENEEHQLSPKTVTFKSPIKSELTVNPSDDNNIVTLTHTVSFYRRQQNQSANNTPIRKLNYAEMNDEETEHSEDEHDSANAIGNHAVQEKVKRLFDEVDKQHQIMKQTSQALNLCAATFEFSGSIESVEGERHLLVATHRREAAKHEIEKLQQQKCLRSPGAPTDRGRLIVKEITVPLRPDYKEKMDSSTICGHHLVCLLKYNETVLATKTVPTLPGLLAVKFPDTLEINNVYADFKVSLEIYGMIAQREVLPHDIKYHINKKGVNRTPKVKKGGDSRLVMPLVESAGGPHVVRTPALSRYGLIELTLREIQRTTWSLGHVTGVSPLHGTVHMKVHCELSVSIDYKGFLTMFEDVSGFGAWHRRWCRLHGHLLSFWRYPDDEKKRPPMGSIDLRNACTQKVTVTPRDVCARLNTFLVELKRPSQDDDKESLVIVRQGKYTIVRYLLSADTKEERETWCAYFNKALAVIRSWQTSH